jgi:hypothetical protein
MYPAFENEPASIGEWHVTGNLNYIFCGVELGVGM